MLSKNRSIISLASLLGLTLSACQIEVENRSQGSNSLVQACTIHLVNHDGTNAFLEVRAPDIEKILEVYSDKVELKFTPDPDCVYEGTTDDGCQIQKSTKETTKDNPDKKDVISTSFATPKNSTIHVIARNAQKDVLRCQINLAHPEPTPEPPVVVPKPPVNACLDYRDYLKQYKTELSDLTQENRSNFEKAESNLIENNSWQQPSDDQLYSNFDLSKLFNEVRVNHKAIKPSNDETTNSIQVIDLQSNQDITKEVFDEHYFISYQTSKEKKYEPGDQYKVLTEVDGETNEFVLTYLHTTVKGCAIPKPKQTGSLENLDPIVLVDGQQAMLATPKPAKTVVKKVCLKPERRGMVCSAMPPSKSVFLKSSEGFEVKQESLSYPEKVIQLGSK